jgi:hypothetical protein
MRGIYSKREGTRTGRTLRLALPLVAIGVLIAALLPAAGSAISKAAPANTELPSILGTPVEGNTLTSTNGIWSNAPTAYAYGWLRCPADGGAADGSNCGVIAGATTSEYQLQAADVSFRIRVRVTATNADGPASAVSNPTNAVTAAPTPPASGCPSGTGALQIEQVLPPARLSIDHKQVSPKVITRSTIGIAVRFHVSACGGRSVQGALVYATAVPYNQFTIPSERQTGGDGWVTFSMKRLSGFPAARQQQLLVMFVRARKTGEPVLAGISTRQLMASNVNLSG